MLLVLFGSFIGSFATVFMKQGVMRLELNLRSLLVNWRLATGVFIYLASTYFYTLGLREGEVTILYPLVSLGYIYTLVWSRMFFGEQFTRGKVLGIVIIMAGAMLLQLGNK